MKTRFKFLSYLLALGLNPLFFVSVQGATLPTRNEIFELLRQENFGELEKITTELRLEKTELGRPAKLTQFYNHLEISSTENNAVWMQHLQMLEKWAKACPESATPLVAIGAAYKSYAWKARGSGWANTVSEEGWKLFSDRLSIAQQYLTSAEGKANKNPEIYRGLLIVAKGECWPRQKMEEAFAKGVALDPNWLDLYVAKAAYLLPRWQGEPGDWEAFAEEAANNRGGDDGDLLYMYIARSQAWADNADFFQNSQIKYDRMKRGFMVSRTRWPDFMWDLNSYCYFACLAHDRETAKVLFTQIKDQSERGVWGTETIFHDWKNWALNNDPVPVTSSRSSPDCPPWFSWIFAANVFGGILIRVLAAAVIVGIWLLARKK